MDFVSLLIGFSIGIVVVGLAIEMGVKKSSQTIPASRPAKKWSISEISNPRIMAEYLGDVEIPKDSKILVKKYNDKTKLEGFEAKEHDSLIGNVIIGDDRALILAGPVKNNELGFWTVEKDIIEQLNSEFEQYWAEASKLTHEES